MPINKHAIRTKEYILTPEFFTEDVALHRRLGCYAKRGVECCVPGCTRKGTHVVHWYMKSDFNRFGDSGVGEHVEIVGYDPDGTEYMMTVDHIVPDSKGGPKLWWNLQPMCEQHNTFQGNLKLYTPKMEWLVELAAYAGLPYVPGTSYQDLLNNVNERYLLKPHGQSKLAIKIKNKKTAEKFRNNKNKS